MSSKAKDYITDEEQEVLAMFAILAEEGYQPRGYAWSGTVRGFLTGDICARCPISAAACVMDPNEHVIDFGECSGPVVHTLDLPQSLATRIAKAADDPGHRLHKPLRFAVFGEEY